MPRTTEPFFTALNSKEDQERGGESLSDVSRRDFVGLSLAAGLGVATSPASGAKLAVIIYIPFLMRTQSI
jgi:hypothetical protein